MNKPIIIDGVDVSECEFYEPKAQVMQCHRGAITQRCKENNCHFKQLQRLKAENEQYKKALEEVRDSFNCFRSCMIPFHIGNKEELPHRMADIIQEHCNNIIQKINEVLEDENH